MIFRPKALLAFQLQILLVLSAVSGCPDCEKVESDRCTPLEGSATTVQTFGETTWPLIEVVEDVAHGAPLFAPQDVVIASGATLDIGDAAARCAAVSGDRVYCEVVSMLFVWARNDQPSLEEGDSVTFDRTGVTSGVGTVTGTFDLGAASYLDPDWSVLRNDYYMLDSGTATVEAVYPGSDWISYSLTFVPNPAHEAFLSESGLRVESIRFSGRSGCTPTRHFSCKYP